MGEKGGREEAGGREGGGSGKGGKKETPNSVL